MKSIIVSERYCNSKVLDQYELAHLKEFLLSTDQWLNFVNLFYVKESTLPAW